ncbi:MAG: FAD-dependent oxidoreductase, partial [Ignavibacteriales bacterium CG12_big_fil_rev_8_21_14_0_65_30_8]
MYDLKNLGVEVILNEKVSMINEKGVLVADRLIETKNILWAAGNKVSSLIKTLETKIDNIGRVIVNDDLSIESNENIFVIGDAAAVKNDKGELLPAIAPVAMQQGKYVAKIISSGLERNYRNKFIYKDRG